MDPYKLIVFDMDKTLTKSKSPLEADMGKLLSMLLEHKKIGVISGASFVQFQNQFLPNLHCELTLLKNLYLLPTDGASLYTYDSSWKPLYEFDLSSDEKKRVMDAFEKAFLETGFQKAETTYGTLIEDRGAQITFSGLGSEAPLSLKEAWDPERKIRSTLVEVLKRELPDFAVSIGGSTSIDINKAGLDKAYGLTQLMKHLGLWAPQVLYVGDALFPGGNDASVIPLGVNLKAVTSPEDTKALIRSFFMNVA